MSHRLVLGVIADTHGHLDDAACAALARSDVILHAGDVGGEGVLERLRSLAPVFAVAGNGDEDLRHRYPWDQRVELGPARVLLCHWYDNFGRLHPRIERELREWEPHVLVYGHTHQAVCERRGAILHFNPGYAGPPGPARPRSVGRLELDGVDVRGEVIPLA